MNLVESVESYNQQATSSPNTHHHLTTADVNGETQVSGGLRIYWGLQNPIEFVLSDDRKGSTLENKRSWRYSMAPSKRELNVPVTNNPRSSNRLNNIEEEKSNSLKPLRENTRLSDDISSYATSYDISEVVFRNKAPIRTKTVSYRGDSGMRWKRASVNGHIYNNDTRVFTPVMGSCTSVMVTDKMTSHDVIKTLLDKFKVLNSPEEFILYIVPDEGSGKQLLPSDIPIKERLKLGPDEKLGKFFLKEKLLTDIPKDAWKTLTGPVSSPILEDNVSEVTPVEKYVEHLPEEVEQLVALPEMLLRGLVKKFTNDEEKDISKIQKKYDRLRKIMMALLSKKESYV